MFKRDKAKKGAAQGINAYVLIFSLIVISAILTYFVPAGQFDKVEKDGREILVADSFQFVDNTPVGFLDIFTSIHAGMVNGAGTIFFVLIIGGVFGIMNATGALDTFVVTFAEKMKRKEKLMIPVFVLFFAICGATMGMSDEVAVYVALIVPLTIALGFDAVTGFAIVVMGAWMGFTAGFLNPFSTAVAQGIAELPTFSGMGLRIVVFIIFVLMASFFIYSHASKVQKNPELGIYGKFGQFSPKDKDKTLKMTLRHKLVLTVFMLNFVVLILGVKLYEWFIPELAGLFLLTGIIMGIVGGLIPSEIANSFVKGASELLGGALIIGLAQAVLVIFQSGGLLDTMLHYMSNMLSGVPSALTAVAMMFIQMVINFLIPSQSGQAALTMPIMSPLADLVNVTRQTAVLAFQLGDGIAALLFPTNGALIAALAVAGIQWNKWVRWYIPFFIAQVIVSIIILIVAHAMNYGPF